MIRIGILLLFLCACTVGEDYKKPEIYSDEVIKKELNLNQKYKLPEKWYAELKDEQLTYLIDRGLQHSPNVETAVSNLKA